MSYKLVDHGYPFKKIMNGKAWVGRVCTHAQGGYLGTIKSEGVNLEVRATTEIEAFEEVVAKVLGYPSAAALKAHNSKARANNRAVKQHARYVVGEMLRGNFKPFDAVLDAEMKRGQR